MFWAAYKAWMHSSLGLPEIAISSLTEASVSGERGWLLVAAGGYVAYALLVAALVAVGAIVAAGTGSSFFTSSAFGFGTGLAF